MATNKWESPKKWATLTKKPSKKGFSKPLKSTIVVESATVPDIASGPVAVLEGEKVSKNRTPALQFCSSEV